MSALSEPRILATRAVVLLADLLLHPVFALAAVAARVRAEVFSKHPDRPSCASTLLTSVDRIRYPTIRIRGFCMRGLVIGCAAALIGVVGTAADAAVFVFSGAFKPATSASFTKLLGDGAYDGSFTITPALFPTSGSATMTAFSVNLRDRSGTILKTLTRGVDNASGYVSSSAAATYGGIVVNIQDSKSDYLQLIVPNGFSGTGAVLANGYSAAQIAPQNQATVVAGTIAAVPEAASWALMIGGFGLISGAMRRRTGSGQVRPDDPKGRKAGPPAAKQWR